MAKSFILVIFLKWFNLCVLIHHVATVISNSGVLFFYACIDFYFIIIQRRILFKVYHEKAFLSIKIIVIVEIGGIVSWSVDLLNLEL